MEVILVRRYNAPVLHRESCRHLDKHRHLVGGPSHSRITVTDRERDDVEDGWLKACRTCKPLAEG